MNSLKGSKPIQLLLQIFFGSTLVLGMFVNGICQSESTDLVDPGDSISQEEVIEKATLRMSFEAFRIDDKLKLRTQVRSKINSKYQNIPGIEVSFYKGDTSRENLIGKDTSNHKGEGIIYLDQSNLTSSSGSIDYYAVVSEHPDYEDVEEMITVNPGVLTMELKEEDSIRTIELFIASIDSGAMTPLAEAECKIFVQRLFGLMPLGDPVTTDEEGKAIFEFPGDIKGDTSGIIKIVAKVSEHEVIGNIQTHKEVLWGIPIEENDFFSQRKLWSARSNSPVLLIVVVNGLIIGIWAAILFIFYEIYRIYKLGKVS